MKRIHYLHVGFAILAAATLLVALAGGGRSSIRFPHEKHVGGTVDLQCSDCHAGAAKSGSGKDDLLPGNDTCANCHSKDDLAGYGWTEPAHRLSGFPKFSHEKHLGMQGVDCNFCHGAVVNPALAGTGKGELGHALCFTCHNGEKAPNRCETCHENVQRMRPLDHGPDYLHDHQFKARGSAGTCEVCHRQSESCSECHQGDNILFRTHDRNYRFTHAEDARKHEHDCTSCHDLQSFCNDCHASEHVKPTNHNDPNWTVGTTLHAAEARRDESYCASCHEQDEICARCHQDKIPGKGNEPNMNIHGSNFDRLNVKGPWHDDPSFYCFDCHKNLTGPDGFCGYCHAPRNP